MSTKKTVREILQFAIDNHEKFGKNDDDRYSLGNICISREIDYYDEFRVIEEFSILTYLEDKGKFLKIDVEGLRNKGKALKFFRIKERSEEERKANIFKKALNEIKSPLA